MPHLTPELPDRIAFAWLTIEPGLVELTAPQLNAAIISGLDALDRGMDRAIRDGYPFFGYGRPQCRDPNHLLCL